MADRCKALTGSSVLVTGGAGFIGSNLAETLLENGNEVRVLDNFSTGKRENIAPLLTRKGFTLLEGDIRDPEMCRKAASGVDFIFHEAALGSVPRSIKDPGTTVDVNIGGFVHILQAAREAGVKRIIYASSSSVYGDSPTLPKVEELTGKALSPYAITKKVDELFAENFSDLFGMELIGLRYFNVFGKRQDPAGEYAAVIPKFAASLIARKSPLIHGDGTQSRDFTYIENVVHANILSALAGKDACNTSYNVACGEKTSLLELFRVLRQELSRFDPAISGIEPGFDAPRQGDIPHSLASIAKGEKFLGYADPVSFAEGLRATAKWYFDTLQKGSVL